MDINQTLKKNITKNLWAWLNPELDLVKGLKKQPYPLWYTWGKDRWFGCYKWINQLF